MGAETESPTPLVRTLLSFVAGATCAATAETEALLAAGLAAGRQACPGLQLSDEEFLRFVGERLRPPAALGELALPDLYLACGCARADPAALALFEAQVMPKLNAPLARFRLGDAALADVRQTTRMLLFVSDGSAPPKIAQYSGRAPLFSWVQVVATRIALRVSRGASALVSDDESLYAMPTPGDAPEVSYLKQHFQAPFREAFLAALAGLGTRERTLLRQSFIDGLSIDELGRLYGVHRATAARQVVLAKRALLIATRTRLMERIQVSAPECDHIMHLVKSRLDVTLRRLMVTNA